MPRTVLKDNTLLLALSIAALFIVIVRACLQNITLDEASSYLIFARESWPAQWYPSSGNHVLNTILMRLITTLVPFNELTIRIPAILGAALYIGSAAYLCALFSRQKLLQFGLFTGLVLNPMILDYLVAARGYSLAIGFLTAALAIFAQSLLTEISPAKCRWISILIALAFASNFAFGIVCAIVLLFVFLKARASIGAGRAALCCFAPGFLVAFPIVGSVVWQFPKSQLYFGSSSLREMWTGFGNSTFDELNPEVLNPMLLRWLEQLRPLLTAIHC